MLTLSGFRGFVPLSCLGYIYLEGSFLILFLEASFRTVCLLYMYIHLPPVMHTAHRNEIFSAALSTSISLTPAGNINSALTTATCQKPWLHRRTRRYLGQRPNSPDSHLCQHAGAALCSYWPHFNKHKRPPHHWSLFLPVKHVWKHAVDPEFIGGDTASILLPLGSWRLKACWERTSFPDWPQDVLRTPIQALLRQCQNAGSKVLFT